MKSYPLKRGHLKRMIQYSSTYLMLLWLLSSNTVSRSFVVTTGTSSNRLRIVSTSKFVSKFDRGMNGKKIKTSLKKIGATAHTTRDKNSAIFIKKA
mgnify:CR=1 FL=1